MLRTIRRHLGQLGRRVDEDQEGATLVMGAIVTTVVLTLFAVVVDLGARVLGDRDIQGAVDLAALDAVLALGELETPDLEGRANELAAFSLDRNQGWSSRDGRTFTTTVGRFDEVARTFTPTLVDPNAVMVTAAADLDRLTGFLPGSDGIGHTAIAELSRLGAIGIGTSVASVDTARASSLDTVMSAFFAGPVTLDAVSWQGLADGSVPLQVLATAFNVGSVDQLLDLEVTAAQLLAAAATGPGADGSPVDVTAASILGDLATSVDGTRRFRIGELLSVDQGVPGSVLDVEVNAMSLVTGSAMLINGANAVDLGIDLSAIPGVTSGSVSATIIEPPQIAIGRPGIGPDGAYRTVARSAQVRLAADLVTDPMGDYAGLTVGSIQLPLAVDAGDGWAGFASAVCGADDTVTSVTNHVETDAARAVFGVTAADSVFTQDAALSGDVRSPLLDISASTVLASEVPVAAVEADGSVTVPGAVGDVLLPGPYSSTARIAGTRPFDGLASDVGELGLAQLLDELGVYATLDALPIGVDLGFSITADAADTSADVNLVTDVVVPALLDARSIVDEVDRTVVAGLADALGIVSVGDAETSAHALDCGRRRLVD